MYKSIMVLAMAGFVGMVSACTNNEPEEIVVIEPEPISSEPVYTGKYK